MKFQSTKQISDNRRRVKRESKEEISCRVESETWQDTRGSKRATKGGRSSFLPRSYTLNCYSCFKFNFFLSSWREGLKRVLH